jgi:plastocyanin
MTVKKGTKLIFKHRDTSLGGGDPGIHNVVAKNGKFKSVDMGFGQDWEYVFNEVGVFEYFCEPHPFMTGKITVVE